VSQTLGQGTLGATRIGPLRRWRAARRPDRANPRFGGGGGIGAQIRGLMICLGRTGSAYEIRPSNKTSGLPLGTSPKAREDCSYSGGARTAWVARARRVARAVPIGAFGKGDAEPHPKKKKTKGAPSNNSRRQVRGTPGGQGVAECAAGYSRDEGRWSGDRTKPGPPVRRHFENCVNNARGQSACPIAGGPT